ncbi:glutamine synthetase [Tateyamaria sp.]|uniref:glutamine synthetase n=1 Tax=Tateyamaria sp. TaxID=1929288 RepID=UPI0032A0B093
MADRLRAMFCDHLSIMRGKYLPASKIKDDETRFCRSTFGVHYDRDLLPAPGAMMMEGLPDMALHWRADDIRNGWEANTKIVLGDLFDDAGAPLALCPRGALKRAVADWGAHGLTPKAGIELEAFAFVHDDDGNLVPYESKGAVVYGTGPFTDPRGFNDKIWETAERLGFRLDMITAEYDAQQFEYTLAFDDAVKAVDDIVLFRQMAREVAYQSGVILTFMPKPVAEAGGSGMHINFSFTDKDDHNVVADGNQGGPEHLTPLARGCISGLLTHHQALAGLIAPTANSYKRLAPASLSGYWQNWGGDHRNVTSRISTEGGAKARMEHRMADASANPYTAVAAVLQAARLGFEAGAALPAMETGDGFETTDATEGTATNLADAIAALEADTDLCAAVGSELCANHIFMKQQEVEKTDALDDAGLRDFYMYFV